MSFLYQMNNRTLGGNKVEFYFNIFFVPTDLNRFHLSPCEPFVLDKGYGWHEDNQPGLIAGQHQHRCLPTDPTALTSLPLFTGSCNHRNQKCSQKNNKIVKIQPMYCTGRDRGLITHYSCIVLKASISYHDQRHTSKRGDCGAKEYSSEQPTLHTGTLKMSFSSITSWSP